MRETLFSLLNSFSSIVICEEKNYCYKLRNKLHYRHIILDIKCENVERDARCTDFIALS